MKMKLRLHFFLVTILISACDLQAGSLQSTRDTQDVEQSFSNEAHALIHANVIPMDRETVLEDYTVVVENGLIVAMGPSAEVDVSDLVSVTDAGGAHLIPGMADMHVHLRFEEDLPLYLASGVTTVLDLGASRVLLEWRDRLVEESLIGPRLLVSYFIDGPGGRFNVENTVESARKAVKNASDSGYDYVKVYNSLSKEQFDGIMEEAAAHNITVIGHAVRSPGLTHSLESGQRLIAHAEEFVYSIFNFQDNRSRIPDAVDLVRRTNTYVIPNLSAFETIARQWGRPDVVETFFQDDRAAYLHPFYHDNWRSGNYTGNSNIAGGLTNRVQFLKELTLAFQQGGVILLAGTDSPTIPGVFAGSSIRHDLNLMVEAGLTPFQALSTATRNAGQFLAETRPAFPQIGVIKTGAAADLVLLNDNPLVDLLALEDQIGVMKSGIWRTAEEMKSHLNKLYSTSSKSDVN